LEKRGARGIVYREVRKTPRRRKGALPCLADQETKKEEPDQGENVQQKIKYITFQNEKRSVPKKPVGG